MEYESYSIVIGTQDSDEDEMEENVVDGEKGQ